MYVFMNHESNVLSSLSPRRLCCNSCTWTHELYMSHVPKYMSRQSHCVYNQEGTLFS